MVDGEIARRLTAIVAADVAGYSRLIAIFADYSPTQGQRLECWVDADQCPDRVYHRNSNRKGRCCCAVGMCGNSRQRVIHISTAVAVIFLRLQVACAVNGG